MQQDVRSLAVSPYSIPGIKALVSMSGLKPGRTCTAEKLQEIQAIWGDISVVSQNLALMGDQSSIPLPEVLRLLEQTGTLYNQPLRTVNGAAKPRTAVIGLMLSGTVTDMSRRVKEYGQACFVSKTLRVTKHVVLCSPERRHHLQQVLPLVMSLRHTPATDEEVLKVLFGDCRFDTWIREPDLETQVRAFAQAHLPCSIYTAAAPNKIHEVLAVRRILREEWGDEFDAKGVKNHRFYFSQGEISLATKNAHLYGREKPHLPPLEMFPSLAHLLNEVFLLWKSAQIGL